MTEITIHPAYIVVVIYAISKAVVSVWVCKREFLYPIWNADGLQVPRGIHHKVQSFLRNWAINPEWGLMKAIAFAPVFLFTGKRHIHSFMPWRVQKTPPFCKECKDKGGRNVKPGFVKKGGMTGWHVCRCQNVEVPKEERICSCPVCLDTGTIGKDRPCPHCERRGLFVRHAQAEVERAKIKNPESCKGCGKDCEIVDLKRIDHCWFCKDCIDGSSGIVGDNGVSRCHNGPAAYVKQLTCEKCGKNFPKPSGWGDKTYKWCTDCYTRLGAIILRAHYHCLVEKTNTNYGTRMTVQKNPHRYLETQDSFCGDPGGLPQNVEKHSSWRRSKPWLKQKQPTELAVGETVVAASIRSGHRDQCRLGQPLRILGLNLPFAVVEYSTEPVYKGASSSRHINVVNLRGMTLYGNRDSSLIKSKEAYQPLLDPAALRVGDKFVLMRLHETRRDGSWRGEAFRCTKPAYKLRTRNSDTSIPEGMVVECEHLSFFKFSGKPTLLSCEGLQIIPVNDQYVKATSTYCPDTGYA